MGLWGPAWECIVADVGAEVRSILIFHLGADEARLMDDARLAEDLGADSLDMVEIVMSCEWGLDIDSTNRFAPSLATVGDAVRFVEAELAGAAGGEPDRRPVRSVGTA